MMNSFRKAISTGALAAALGVGAVVDSANAQTTGVGSDNYTRVLWRTTAGGVVLWKLNAELKEIIGSATFGPYDGWVPVAITVGQNNYTYLLWRRTDGLVSLWKIDPGLNWGGDHAYGPFLGWTAQTLSIRPDDSPQVVWRNTNGELAIWAINGSTLDWSFDGHFGPYFGYDPGPAASGP